MLIRALKKEGLVLPTNAHETDTGYDIVATSEPRIVGNLCGSSYYYSVDFIEYDTELQIAPDRKIFSSLVKGDCGYTLAFPRSSISKYNLLLANSVAIIDHSYRGNILLRFKYLWQPSDFVISEAGPIAGIVNLNGIYKKGDRIAQLVAAWKEPIEWKLVDSLDETSRGEGGFGSTS